MHCERWGGVSVGERVWTDRSCGGDANIHAGGGSRRCCWRQGPPATRLGRGMVMRPVDAKLCLCAADRPVKACMVAVGKVSEMICGLPGLFM